MKTFATVCSAFAVGYAVATFKTTDAPHPPYLTWFVIGGIVGLLAVIAPTRRRKGRH